jgi:hypothetical protein
MSKKGYEKENEVLRKQNFIFREIIVEEQQEIKQLKQKIESMKNCQNCKHQSYSDVEFCYNCDRQAKGEVIKDNWVLND